MSVYYGSRKYRFYGDGDVTIVSGDQKHKILLCSFENGQLETEDKLLINILIAFEYDYENLDPVFGRKNSPIFRKPSINMTKGELLEWAKWLNIYFNGFRITKSQILEMINKKPLLDRESQKDIFLFLWNEDISMHGDCLNIDSSAGLKTALEFAVGV